MENFIISLKKQMWIEDAGSAFIVDPFVASMVSDDNVLTSYKMITRAKYLRVDKAEQDKAITFVTEKYEKYIPILSRRLNALHKVEFPDWFWRKAFSVMLYRYIVLFHDVFAKGETYFNPEKHVCNILHPESYYVPVNFEDHRSLFQSTHFGQEQIFSLYMTFFYPDRYKCVELLPDDKELLFKRGGKSANGISVVSKLVSLVRKKGILFPFVAIKKIYQGCRIVILQRKIKVLLLNCLFEECHFTHLSSASRGKVEPLHFPIAAGKYVDTKTDKSSRSTLGQNEIGFDRFDQFFFSTLPYCLPKAYIENFLDVYHSSCAILKKYSSVKHILAECFIVHTYEAMFLAIAKVEKATHDHYVEHNAFFHPFTCGFVSLVSRMVDTYVTMGWEGANLANGVKGASLYPFYTTPVLPKTLDILYVSYSPESKTSYYGGMFAWADEASILFLEFIKKFWAHLDENTKKRIFYRGSPQINGYLFLGYNKEKYLKDDLRHTTVLLPQFGSGESCKEQMARANLVIIDYSSTAYLEALHMNIPFIFLWDPNTKRTEVEYAGFYDSLIDVGICHTDPVSAAKFVEQVKDNPMQWWQGERAQAGRHHFMTTNFGKKSKLINYILNLTR